MDNTHKHYKKNQEEFNKNDDCSPQNNEAVFGSDIVQKDSQLQPKQLNQQFYQLKEFHLNNFSVSMVEPSQRMNLDKKLESFNYQQEKLILPYYSGLHDKYLPEGYEVLGLDESTPFNVTLTRIRVEANLNDFAVIAIIGNYTESKIRYYFRSGRIGCHSQIQTIETTFNGAIRLFQSTYFSLTGNSWSKNMENFDHNFMKFNILRTTKTELPTAVTDIDLCPSIIDLIELIMTHCTPKMTTLDLLADKRKGLTELGRLEPCEIKKAAECLVSIHNQKNTNMELLNKLNNNFYQAIPLSFQEGSNIPLIVGGKSRVIPEMSRLLDFIKEPFSYPTCRLSKKQYTMQAYEKYKFEIKLVDKESFYGAMIESAINQITIPECNNPTLLNIFMLHDKIHDFEFVSLCKDLGNCHLLWHGTKLLNINSILKTGLQITPMQATANGLNHGSGLYFTDIISCAVNFSRDKESEEVIVLLCNVILGLPEKRRSYQYKPPPDPYNSVFHEGYYNPNECKLMKIDGIDLKFKVGDVRVNKSEDLSEPVLCNEVVVYNTSQVKPAFLVHLRL